VFLLNYYGWNYVILKLNSINYVEIIIIIIAKKDNKLKGKPKKGG